MIWAAALQSILAIVAGWGLFMLWRAFEREGIAVWIVALGFAGRAISGVVLFWVSWLRLPLATSLQVRDGLWFFGLDGLGYYREATAWVSKGFGSVILPDRSNPSYVFVQVLALGRIIFGTPLSVALLLNVSFYLAAAFVIARRGKRSGRPRTARLSLIGFSLTPSFVLWSTQPLKDTLFMLLVVVFFDSFLGWTESNGEGRLNRERLLAAILLVATAYLVGGIRWYYAAILWMLFLPFSIWSGLTGRTASYRRAGLSVAVFVLMGLVLSPNLPAALGEGLGRMVRVPASLLSTLQQSRVAFETKYDAATLIEPGPVIELLPHSEVVARGVLAFVPRFIAEPLGLASAGGGRGLWFFAEADTMFVILLAVVVARRLWRERESVRNAGGLFAITLFVASLPMLYAVNNFGSLLRFREMLVIPFLLVPLSFPPLAAPREATGSFAESDGP